MDTIYTLSTCDTSRRILNRFPTDDFKVIDIKKEGISAEGLERMRSMTSSYEELFSKRSRSYSAMGLKEKQLSEEDLKSLILKDYTFLKRPVVIKGDQIFIGNQKKNVEALYSAMGVND